MEYSGGSIFRIQVGREGYGELYWQLARKWRLTSAGGGKGSTRSWPIGTMKKRY
jgi:hypothetical protein